MEGYSHTRNRGDVGHKRRHKQVTIGESKGDPSKESRTIPKSNAKILYPLMPANLHDKLINLEVSPPATSWENISRRLDEEFDVAEIRLSQKLMDATATPPANLWEILLSLLFLRGRKKNASPV